jgi:hypothetical protein
LRHFVSVRTASIAAVIRATWRWWISSEARTNAATGMAVAGLVMGYLGIALTVVYVIAGVFTVRKHSATIYLRTNQQPLQR